MIRDLLYGARMLMKHPRFTLMAGITLTLGIGANTAIFTVVNGALLRPLPFPEPERRIGIRESKVGEGNGNPLAWRSFFAFRDQAQTIEAIAAYFHWNPDIERDDGTVRVLGTQVSHGYFQVMGVPVVRTRFHGGGWPTRCTTNRDSQLRVVAADVWRCGRCYRANVADCSSAQKHYRKNVLEGFGFAGRINASRMSTA